MALTVLSPLLGGGAFARLGLLTQLPEPVRPAVKWVHRKIGSATWGAGTVAMLLVGCAQFRKKGEGNEMGKMGWGGKNV